MGANRPGARRPGLGGIVVLGLAVLGGCASTSATAERPSDRDDQGLFARLLAAVPSLRSDHMPTVRSQPTKKPGTTISTDSVRGRLVQVVTHEWQFFGGAQWRLNKPSIRGAGLEHQPGYRERVIRYWSDGLGRRITNTRAVGWSGAFISYVMKAAGADRRFPYSGTHVTYIARAIRNRKEGRTDASIVGYRPREYAPRPGDMICNSLTSGVDYDNIQRRYSAHCDIVVARGFRRVDVIGGNLTNSVRKRSLLTDENGFVFPKQPRKIDPYVKRWFVIVKVNM